jgi:hypothetical protein
VRGTRGKWTDVRVYRIEWEDGAHTGTGLFASLDTAQQYATGKGWRVSLEMPVMSTEEEECA